ncbi:MAG: glycosyltransferase family 4 protein [Planctomycetota bacterium]
MRIVYFQFVPHYGGAARSCVEFCRRLSEHVDVSIVDPYGTAEMYGEAIRNAGLDYHVLCPDQKQSYIGGHGNPLSRALRIGKALPDLLGVRRRAAQVLGELQPSVVCSDSFKSGVLMQTCLSLRSIPLVLYLRGWYTPEKMPWYGKWLCRKRAAMVWAVSRATEGALRCAGVDPRRIRVLHNPIDVDASIARAKRPFDAEPPQMDRPVRILLPAGIMRAKGQHTAVDALARLVADGYDPVLWIAGDHQAIGKNKHYVDEVRALAVSLGVTDRVEWLGLRHDVPQLMNAATVVTLPSHTEGHPRVILEAMSLARPIAATPVGGIQDMIMPEVTGLLFEVDDAEGLARCIRRFADDPADAGRMGRQGQDYIRRCFRMEQQTEKALAFLRQAAEKEPGR